MKFSTTPSETSILSKENPMNKCPNCGKNFAMVGASAHCANKSCTWVKCTCKNTVDTVTGKFIPSTQ